MDNVSQSDSATGGAGTTASIAASTAISRKRVSPRVLLVGLAVLALVLGAVLAVVLAMRPKGGVELAPLPSDQSVAVSLAGSFPGPDQEPLDNPLGLAIDGGRVYVAEADAGRIQVFDLNGGRFGEIALASAEEALAVYPTSVAATGDGRLAVVDSAAGRVLVIDAKIGDAAVLMTLGERQESTAPLQPTAVAFADDTFYVSDGVTHTVKVYGDDGLYQGEVGASVTPALTYPGGLAAVGHQLVVADSNAGRVLAIDLDPEAAHDFPDRYTLPRGVTGVRDGVAVTDVFAAAVYVCDDNGTRTHTIDADTLPGSPLVSPEGVAWADGAERLYVTDSTRGKVVVFNVRI